MYLYDGTREHYPGIVGDGISDDTQAIQNAIDNNNVVILPPNCTFKITDTLEIDVKTLKLFDGNNSKIIVSGAFEAFHVSGLCTVSSNPSNQTDSVKEDEAASIIRNVRIIGTTSVVDASCGIKLSGCFKTRIENCYIYNVTDGIIISGINRDLMFSGNQIYGVRRYGIHIDSTVNLHQFNIVNNIIHYAKYCIYLDDPEQIANWQLSGNDIEISYYPTAAMSSANLADYRCIVITSDNTKSGQLSEIEITGNTIQGHNQSETIIDISGGTGRYIQLISISGNHISNLTGGAGVKLVKTNNVAISGNTFKYAADGGKCFSVANSKNVSITGNTCDTVEHFATIDNLSSNIVVVGNAGETSDTAIVSSASAGNLVAESNLFTTVA